MYIKANEVKVGDIIQMRSTRSSIVKRDVWEVIYLYRTEWGLQEIITSDGITRKFQPNHEFWLINSMDRLVPVEDW